MHYTGGVHSVKSSFEFEGEHKDDKKSSSKFRVFPLQFLYLIVVGYNSTDQQYMASYETVTANFPTIPMTTRRISTAERISVIYIRKTLRRRCHACIGTVKSHDVPTHVCLRACFNSQVVTVFALTIISLLKFDDLGKFA